MLNGEDIEYLREQLEGSLGNDDGYIRSVYHKLGRLGYYLNKVVMSEKILSEDMKIRDKYHIPKVLIKFDEKKTDELLLDFILDNDLAQGWSKEELENIIKEWLPTAIIKQKTKL